MIEVPFFEPDIGVLEEQAVLEVLRSNWITMGPKVEAFEKGFAEFLGVEHAIAVNSCTAALHLAYITINAGHGDEIIMPSLTFAATANAAVYTGATPVFADISSIDDWTLSPDHVESLITPRTKAIVPMHYAGYPCDMEALRKICDRNGVFMIEDACHAIGASIDEKAMGTFGRVGCFSFYSNKGMTTAEGGMLVTMNPKLAEQTRRLRSHGQTKTAIDRARGALSYDIDEIGYNYRMDDLRASLGLVQLSKLDSYAASRKILVDSYRLCLSGMDGITFPSHGSRGRPANYLLPVLLDERFNRDYIQKNLKDNGIQTSMHYPPVHLLSHYRENNPVTLPNTERVAQSCMTLPLYPNMPQDSVFRVCDVLANALN